MLGHDKQCYNATWNYNTLLINSNRRSFPFPRSKSVLLICDESFKGYSLILTAKKKNVFIAKMQLMFDKILKVY